MQKTWTGKARFEHNNRPDVVHGHTTEISEPMAKLSAQGYAIQKIILRADWNIAGIYLSIFNHPKSKL